MQLLLEAAAQAVAEERARLRRPGSGRRARPGARLRLTIVAFVAFCLAASGIYFWNDLLDVEADRLHPTKRNRPIASGQLSIGIGPDRSGRCCR